MRAILLVIILMITGCGKPPQDVVVSPQQPILPIVVDASIAPYFIRFTQNIGIDSNGISANLAALTYPTLGQCTISGPNKTVTIDPTFWANASDNEHEELVFHELGHCAMGLGHINTLNPYNCPDSIMYQYEFGSSTCYANSKPYYYGELAGHR